MPRNTPLEIDGNDGIEVRFVVVLHRHDFAFDAGIVEEAVDRTMGIERSLDVILHIARFRDVGLDDASIAATLTHKFGARLDSGFVEIDHHYLGTAPAKPSAVARPMPPPPPVISATLPENSIPTPPPRRLAL